MLKKYLLPCFLLCLCAGCSGPNSPQHIGDEITEGLANTGEMLEQAGDDVEQSLEGSRKAAPSQ